MNNLLTKVNIDFIVLLTRTVIILVNIMKFKKSISSYEQIINITRIDNLLLENILKGNVKMKHIIGVLISLSLLISVLNGKLSEVNSSIITSTNNAVELCISLAGIMALWSGLMKIAEESKLVSKVTKILQPILSFLFNDLPKKSKAISLIAMNVTANLMGLGNASTPLGLSAMKEIERECGESEVARNSMVMLVVLNSASIQIFPTTIIAMRVKHGSEVPSEVLPMIWVVSTLSCLSAVFVAKIFMMGKKYKNSRRN